jgi:GNAT superfamily N-acetyltransferase
MNTSNQDTPVFRSMELGDIESVLALGKFGLTYVDLAVADPTAHGPTSLNVIGGLTYGDLSAIDPDSPQAMNLVAEINDKVIGVLLAYVHFVGIPITKISIIRAIVVDPDYQKQGIATQLLQHLQSKCKEEGIPVIRMLIPQHSAQLKNYMKSQGFHQSNVLNFDKLI